MGQKTVIITAGEKNDTKTLTFDRVTEVKISEELDSDIVKTFDEPVSVPSSDGGYSVDISALEARNVQEFKVLKQILKRLKTHTGSITVSEEIKVKGEDPFLNTNMLDGVTLTSNEVTYDAEDLTARELSFNAESMTEYIGDDEIKWD
jgi:hypothetical protein